MRTKIIHINGKRYEVDRDYVIDTQNLKILDAPAVRKMASEIAMSRLNKSCDAIANLALMTFKDLMQDLLEEYPLIKNDSVKLETFRQLFLKYMEDYDSGIFSDDDLRTYLKKNKIRRVWKP